MYSQEEKLKELPFIFIIMNVPIRWRKRYKQTTRTRLNLQHSVHKMEGEVNRPVRNKRFEVVIFDHEHMDPS